MRAIGVVRRVDDLGRIVIPKETRSALGIKDGDPLEISTLTNGSIVLQKPKKIPQGINNILDPIREALNMPLEFISYDSIKADPCRYPIKIKEIALSYMLGTAETVEEIRPCIMQTEHLTAVVVPVIIQGEESGLLSVEVKHVDEATISLCLFLANLVVKYMDLHYANV